MKQVHSGEEIGCVVLELGYFIDFKNKKLEDPLSVTFSLTESEKVWGLRSATCCTRYVSCGFSR